MSNCKNCIYWDGENNATGTCNKVEETGYERKPKVKTNQLTFEIYADADDDSGLHSYLTTGCNFGCVLFKEK